MAEGDQQSESTDMFSLGVILYEMCFFEYPWPKQPSCYKTVEVQREILTGNLNFNNQGREISNDM